MPVRYEPSAPVAAAGNIYEQNYALQLQRQNAEQQAQMAAAASHGGGGGGYGGGGGFDIQSAIQHRDQMQFAQERDNLNRNTVDAGQQFQANVAQKMQRDKFKLEAELSQTQLSQQENMRLQRMKNAIGDVQNDATLSSEEKADMVTQLKTGIDPLARRQAAAKLAMDQQQKEAMAEQYNAQAALRKQEAEVTGKTAKERTSFVPDPKHLSDIVADLQDKVPYTLADRDATISKMAEAEAMRQGLGHHIFQEGYGKWKILSGPGSDADKQAAAAAGKGKDSGHPTGLDPQQYLKAREQAEAQAHKEQTIMVDNNGVKSSVHPQTIEWKNERVQQILKSMGLPANMQEYGSQLKATGGGGKSGYNRDAAPWNKGRASPGAAAAAPPAETPAGQGAAANVDGTAAVAAINRKANDHANAVLNDDRIPGPVRTQLAEKIGVVRRLLTAAGGNPDKLDRDKRAQYDEAAAYIAKNDPDQNKPAAPTAAPAAPAAPPAVVPQGAGPPGVFKWLGIQ